MEFRQKALYTILISGNYTAVIFISLGSKYFDILLTTVVLSMIGYGFLLYYIKKISPDPILNYSDVVVNVFIYTFISFSIAFMAVIFAEVEFTIYVFGLMLLPTFIWAFVWIDMLFKNTQHRDLLFVKAK